MRRFYIKAADYVLDNLPFYDPVLQNSKFVDFMKKDTQDFSQVEYFVGRYSYDVLCYCHSYFKLYMQMLLPYESTSELDKLNFTANG